MFDFERHPLSKQSLKYTLTRDGRPQRYGEVLDLWERSVDFRGWFIALLSDAPYAAYRWETPCISSDNMDENFEFVLHDAPWLEMEIDALTFQHYFSDDDSEQGVVVFDNLGRDAVLIAPSPRADHAVYLHLARFMREAPGEQRHALWQVVARTVLQNLGKQPRWLSTAGGGVAWLHVRFETTPKYYSHAPYASGTTSTAKL